MSPVPPSAVAAVYANRRVLLVALLVSLGVVGGYWGKRWSTITGSSGTSGEQATGLLEHHEVMTTALTVESPAKTPHEEAGSEPVASVDESVWRQQLRQEVVSTLKDAKGQVLSMRYRDCPRHVIAERARPGADQEEDGASEVFRYTNRGLSEHAFIHPPWFSLDDAMDAGRTDFSLLEIGIGNGRALLQVQAAHPEARCYGTNYGGYARHLAQNNSDLLVQTESEQDFFSVALSSSIPVPCVTKPGTQQPLPVVPIIKLLPSFGDKSFRLTQYFSPSSKDFIISIHALNNNHEKVLETCHYYLPSVVKVLSPGGTAILHIGSMYVSPVDVPKVTALVGPPSELHTIAVFGDKVSADGDVSAFLYHRGREMGVLFRKHGDDVTGEEKQAFDQPFLDRLMTAAQVDRLMEGVVKLTESSSLTNKDLRLLAQWLRMIERIGKWEKWAY